jgi:hypothetical protein
VWGMATELCCCGGFKEWIDEIEMGWRAAYIGAGRAQNDCCCACVGGFGARHGLVGWATAAVPYAA